MRDFLEWLWAPSLTHNHHYGELRILGGPNGPVQEFHDLPAHLDRLLVTAKLEDEYGHEVYVGVIPRVRPAGTANDVSGYSDVLWADVDAKHHGQDKQAALDVLLDFPVPPSVIVDSGHGYHAYWKIDRPDWFSSIQPVMKGIAKRIGGDAVYDAARILRLPGLSNHKDGGNAPVRLIRFDTTLTYPLSDLAEYAYVEPKTGIWGDERIWLNKLADAYDKITAIDFTFDPGKGQRSEHDYGVVCYLIEHGWTDEEIVAAFLENPTGIGAKTQKQGLRYLERTIRRAHQVTR